MESKTVEYKREYTEDIKYAIVAFANTDGGKIYISVDDDGHSCGISEPDKKDIDFGKSQMRTLNLVGEDNTFTNLAMLLLDQCVHTLKLAIFQGSQKTVFLDRREFTGSLLEQFEEALLSNNKLLILYNSK